MKIEWSWDQKIETKSSFKVSENHNFFGAKNEKQNKSKRKTRAKEKLKPKFQMEQNFGIPISTFLGQNIPLSQLRSILKN